MLATNVFLLGLTAPGLLAPLPSIRTDPVAVSRPDPALTAEQHHTPARRVFLLPDGRTVRVLIMRGACEGIAAATMTREGPRVTLGTDPGFTGFCRANLEPDSVLIPLS